MNWNPWLWWVPSEKPPQLSEECRLRRQLASAIAQLENHQEEAAKATQEARHAARNLRMIIESVGAQMAKLKHDGKLPADE
jgi:hypothetical protein